MSVNSLGILLNVYLCSFLRRTDHSSKLRVCANQQALHIGPVAAAGCAGAAEASAAPPSEPQPCPRSIAAHLHHLASLKGSENHSLTSALQSSGPMPPCSAPPPNPPQSVSKGSEVQHQAVTTSDGEAAAAQRKHFRVYFLFLKSLSFCFHLDQLWWVMYSSSDIQSGKICDIYSSRWAPEGALDSGCCSFCFMWWNKRWMRQRPLCLEVPELHLLLSYNLMLM